MILHNSYPGVVTATIDEQETRVIHDATADLVSHLPAMSETDFLDTMAERASVVREQLPELTEFFGERVYSRRRQSVHY